MTEAQIIEIWKSLPAQGDPTGKKFAIKFAQEVLRIQQKNLNKGKE